MNDLEALAKLGDEIVETVKTYVAMALAPLTERIVQVEKMLPQPGPRGDKGEKGDAATLDLAVLEALVKRVFDEVPKPKDGVDGKDGAPGSNGRDGESLRGDRGEKGEPGDPGQDVDLPSLIVRMREEIDKAVTQIPVAKDGRDGRDAELDMGIVERVIGAEIAHAVAALPKERGKAAEVDMGLLARSLTEPVLDHVSKFLAAMTPPKDGPPGKDAVLDMNAVNARIDSHLKAMIDEALAKQVAALEVPAEKLNAAIMVKVVPMLETTLLEEVEFAQDMTEAIIKGLMLPEEGTAQPIAASLALAAAAEIQSGVEKTASADAARMDQIISGQELVAGLLQKVVAGQDEVVDTLNRPVVAEYEKGKLKIAKRVKKST